MMKRIALLITGLGLLAAGGYGGWIVRDAASSLLAPPAGAEAWLLVAALLAICTGLVLAFASVRITLEPVAAARARAGGQHGTSSSPGGIEAGPASAAERDWRSGPLPPGPSDPGPSDPGPSDDVLFDPDQPVRTAPTTPAADAAVPDAPAATADPSATEALTHIRKAIQEGALERAGQMLSEERSRLSTLGDPAPLAVAELIAIDGDLNDAAGRSEKAQWLWRLALKRYTDAGAASAPLARMLAGKVSP